MQELLQKVKTALRISSPNKQIEGELADLIEACKLDLALAGVRVINEDDALIARAVTLYVKAEFGYTDKSEKYKQSYDLLKMSLSLSGDYNEPPALQFKTGDKVIVNGKVYAMPDTTANWKHKSNAIMVITGLCLDYAQVKELEAAQPEGYAKLTSLIKLQQ